MKYDFVDESKGVPVKKFDAESAVAHFEAAFSKAITKMYKQAEALVVSNEADVSKATEMSAQAKSLFKKVETKRVDLKRPYLDFTQTLDGVARNIKRPLVEIQKMVEAKIAPVVLAIEEQKEKARLAAEKKAKAEAAKADKSKAPVFNMPQVVKPSAVNDGKIQTNTGSVTVEKETKWEMVDFEAIPMEYKIVTLDEKKIDAAIKNGSMIPGLRVYQDSKVTTRLNR